MRANEIFVEGHAVQEEILAELKMSPSSLTAFAKSEDAEGILAGFEAELVFTGRVEYDEPPSQELYSFEDTIQYFGGWGSNSGDAVSNWMSEDISEWEQEQFFHDGRDDATVWLEENFDKDDFIREYLEDEMELEEEDVDTAMEEKNDNYQKANKAYKEDFDDQLDSLMNGTHDDFHEAVDYYRESNAYHLEFRDWMRDRGISNISDVAYRAGVDIPYEYAESDDDDARHIAREHLASDFEDHFDVPVEVSYSYHGIDKDDVTWVFEPDSSIETSESSDVAVEIVSPPMPLEQTLEMIEKVFQWAENNDGYTNDSTGFHMSVSLPTFEQVNIDYLKLVLFLGDLHVLEQFGREANTYAKSSFENIKRGFIRDGVDDIFEKLRDDFNIAARDALSVARSNNASKFVSVNDKAGYVEFRSAGGDYIGDAQKAQMALMRYAKTLKVASDPKEERIEYAKKLYRLLSDVREELGGSTDNLQLFVKYSAGVLPKSTLKSFLKQRARTKK